MDDSRDGLMADARGSASPCRTGVQAYIQRPSEAPAPAVAPVTPTPGATADALLPECLYHTHPPSTRLSDSILVCTVLPGMEDLT
ncbi:hypothetical protein MAPG_05607 [Magnaporthiopsis poae ATCC 64411]|uniref:Uncharacterized protein n=1 Tax=Magnaporthiopsis poae (strain ATCC 64411 / 73-15) TaxID=644358 RepID=A0A0C4DZU9_MAGP6|nr:hypothetical protein MAPG_05607 [Magnaporthiopsis poae ATCC 64411]